MGPCGVAQCRTAWALESAAPQALARSIDLNITHPNHRRASVRSMGWGRLHGTPLSKEPAVGFTHSSSKTALAWFSKRCASAFEQVLAGQAGRDARRGWKRDCRAAPLQCVRTAAVRSTAQQGTTRSSESQPRRRTACSPASLEAADSEIRWNRRLGADCMPGRVAAGRRAAWKSSKSYAQIP